MTYDFANKIVAVLGLARSGLACAEVLTERGAQVRLYDAKPADQLTEGIAAARALGIEPRVGGVPVDYAELDLLITSPGVRKNAPVLQRAVAAGVPVWGEIEAAYRIARAPILAITGTNGKTTTTVLLGEMLKAAGIETYIAGNIAAGDLAMPLIKAAHLAGPKAAIVAEISSFQLEWIEMFRPKVAALLNISPDHQDRQTWDEYVAAKWRIFENQTGRDFAVLTVPLVQQYPQLTKQGEIFYFGIPGQMSAPWLQNVHLPGLHNRENILAASMMAGLFGVSPEVTRQVATTFTGVVHRLEYVDTIENVRYINNSMCTNVAAFEKSLEALPEPKVVIAGGVFKGDDVTPLAEAVRKNSVRALVLIGRSGPAIADAARAAGFADVYEASSMTDAVTQASQLAQAGDAVLLAPACASFDMFRDFEDRGDQFKAAVQNLTPVANDRPSPSVRRG